MQQRAMVKGEGMVRQVPVQEWQCMAALLKGEFVKSR